MLEITADADDDLDLLTAEEDDDLAESVAAIMQGAKGGLSLNFVPHVGVPE